jgi:adenine phosphoribosyltransferase
VIHDDLLATGGTAIAAAKLVIQQGAVVDGFLFIVELDFLKGRERLEGFSKNINSIIKY